MPVYYVKDSDVRSITSWLELTHKTVHISKSCVCRIYGMPGVPLKRADACIDSRVERIYGNEWIATISSKQGKCGGGVKPRILIRQMAESECKKLGVVAGQLSWGQSNGTAWIDLSGNIIRQDQLRTTLLERGDRLFEVFKWNVRRFSHLGWDDSAVHSHAVLWSESFWKSEDPKTINSAHRSVARYLYQQSVLEGWRKMTRRERVAIGLDPDSACWQRRSFIDRIKYGDGFGEADGCGEATHDAAYGEYFYGEDDEAE